MWSRMALPGVLSGRTATWPSARWTRPTLTLCGPGEPLESPRASGGQKASGQSLPIMERLSLGRPAPCCLLVPGIRPASGPLLAHWGLPCRSALFLGGRQAFTLGFRQEGSRPALLTRAGQGFLSARSQGGGCPGFHPNSMGSLAQQREAGNIRDLLSNLLCGETERPQACSPAPTMVLHALCGETSP